MTWFATGLVLATVFTLLLLLRNRLVIPFINSKNTSPTNPVKVGEALAYFIILTICGPASVIGIVCLLIATLIETTNHLKLPDWVNKDL